MSRDKNPYHFAVISVIAIIDTQHFTELVESIMLLTPLNAKSDDSFLTGLPFSALNSC